MLEPGFILVLGRTKSSIFFLSQFLHDVLESFPFAEKPENEITVAVPVGIGYTTLFGGHGDRGGFCNDGRWGW